MSRSIRPLKDKEYLVLRVLFTHHPGMKTVEICRKVNLSATPVRHALYRLRLHGMVVLELINITRETQLWYLTSVGILTARNSLQAVSCAAANDSSSFTNYFISENNASS